MKKRLPLAELVPGMALAADMCREDGVLLLPAGTALSERHLALFPVWGMETAVVADPGGSLGDDAADATQSVPAPEPLTPEQWQAAAAAIRPRFVHVDLEHPGMAAIFALCPPRAARLLRQRSGVCVGLPTPVSPESLPQPAGGPPPGPMALIESDPKLSSLPDVFVRISEVLNDPLSTSQEAAEAIGKDTGLSAKLLRLVNSAFYGFPVKVDTLSRAVTIVGSRQLTTLALGLSVIAVFKDLPEGLVDMRSFWKHSIGCGVVAANLPGPNGSGDMERLFVAGLLHDVGRLVLYRCLPKHLARILAMARTEGKLLREVERRELGYDHAALGGMLLRRWRFPENLEKAVRHHHGLAAMPQAPMPAAVHVADVTIGALGLGSSGEVYVPPLRAEAWNVLELTPERMTTAVATSEVQIEDILRAFLPEDA